MVSVASPFLRLALLLTLVCAAAPLLAAAPSQDATEDFEGFATGTHLELETAVGLMSAGDRNLRVLAADPREPDGDLVLRLAPSRGVEGPLTVTWTLPEQASGGEVIVLDLRRAARGKGFSCKVVLKASGVVTETRDLGPSLRVGEFERFHLAVPPATLTCDIVVTGRAGTGVELGRMVLEPAREMEILGVEARHVTAPLTGGATCDVAEVVVHARGALQPLALEQLDLTAVVPGHTVDGVSAEGGLTAEARDGAWTLRGSAPLVPGPNRFRVGLDVAEGSEGPPPGAPVDLTLAATVGGTRHGLELAGTPARTARRMVNGLGTVDALALTSIPAGKDEERPVVLVAQSEGRLHAFTSRGTGAPRAAAFAGGAPSIPGLAPALLVERGQRAVRLYFQDGPAGPIHYCTSADGGASWSAPESVAVQGIEQGQLLLQAGRGLTVSTGGWLLPVLQELPDGVKVPAVLTSRDRGATFTLSPHISRPMSTVSLVELGDGAVLADCGQPARGRRYLESTRDLGSEWTDALGRRRPLLPCSGRPGALIHIGRELAGSADWRLLFMNPATSDRRPSRMTIRGSNDNGDNWLEKARLLVDEGRGCGAPGLAMVSGDHVVVAYRSSRGELVAQWIEDEAVVGPVMSLFDVFGSSQLGR